MSSSAATGTPAPDLAQVRAGIAARLPRYAAIAGLDFLNDPQALDKREALKSFDQIVRDGLHWFGGRDDVQRFLLGAVQAGDLNIDEALERLRSSIRRLNDAHGRVLLDEVLLPYDRLIGRFKKPDTLAGLSAQGRLAFGRALDGRPLAEWDVHALRRQFALVSQDVVLFDLTIAENIANAGLVASSEADAYRSRIPVFAAVLEESDVHVFRAEREAIGPFYPPRRRSEKGGRPSDSRRSAISLAGLDGG